MIIIRFNDAESERRAIGYLVGRFSGKSYANGDTLVPEAALSHLAVEGIAFTVIGPATYDRLVPLRNPAAVAV
ncbi:MAG TPA: hypothetical protein VIK59_08205 [Verrucomicrobiae bacterium]